MAKKTNRIRKRKGTKRPNRTKRMILGLFIYLLILIIVLLPAKFINSFYGYVPFFTVLILIILSVLHLFYMKVKLSMMKDFADVECVRGKEIELKIKVINKSFLLCPKACVVFYISDLFGEDDTILTTEFTIAGKSYTSFPFSVKMEHVGKYNAGIKQIYIYDMLGFLTVNIKGEGKFEINVAPKIDYFEGVGFSERISIESSMDVMTSKSDGSDYMGVREYVLGDSIKRIHWKLSAHAAGYMTKLMESSRENDVSVIIDFISPDYDKETKMEIYDCIVESSLSFVGEVQKNDVSSSVIFNSVNKEIVRIFPKSDDGFREIIDLLPVIQSKPDKDFADAGLLMESEEKLLNRSSNVAVFTSTVSDVLIQGLIKVKRQDRNPSLYIILPLDMVQREREDYIAPLRNLDDYSIPYYIILPKP